MNDHNEPLEQTSADATAPVWYRPATQQESLYGASNLAESLPPPQVSNKPAQSVSFQTNQKPSVFQLIPGFDASVIEKYTDILEEFRERHYIVYHNGKILAVNRPIGSINLNTDKNDINWTCFDISDKSIQIIDKTCVDESLFPHRKEVKKGWLSNLGRWGKIAGIVLVGGSIAFVGAIQVLRFCYHEESQGKH